MIQTLIPVLLQKDTSLIYATLEQCPDILTTFLIHFTLPQSTQPRTNNGLPTKLYRILKREQDKYTLDPGKSNLLQQICQRYFWAKKNLDRKKKSKLKKTWKRFCRSNNNLCHKIISAKNNCCKKSKDNICMIHA